MNTSRAIPTLAAALLLAAFSLNASTVQVTFDGTSSVSNGSEFVLPYYLTINSGPEISADCYDFIDHVWVGETWTANVDTVAQAAATGKYSGQPGSLQGYKLIGVLSTLPTPTAQSQIDIQQDLWNVFDPGAFTVTPDMAADLATAVGEIPTFNFARVEYLEATMGNAQNFVLSTPEPASLLLIGTGTLVIGLIKRRRSATNL